MNNAIRANDGGATDRSQQPEPTSDVTPENDWREDGQQGEEESQPKRKSPAPLQPGGPEREELFRIQSLNNKQQ